MIFPGTIFVLEGLLKKNYKMDKILKNYFIKAWLIDCIQIHV